MVQLDKFTRSGQLKKVIIDGACGCLRKSGMKAFVADSDAKLYEEVNDMISYMNSNFCKFHKFGLEENSEELIIKVKQNECTQEI
ncbi:MAG: Unknown protein [uncultured Campylobacterales bacterium]|uniref:Uncharacterized protein n=1 Tax=uncultured Campylobacterales bacterium TaxID=352960 RepID=A0A6S6SKZ5_9BACT|nr:MAG: Unknown protein [uncultured Campylobacterales bacterium]